MASVIYHFNNQLLSSGVIKIFRGSHNFEDGGHLRDFIEVGDAIDLTIWLSNRRPADSGIYNCGTGVARTFNDVAQLVIDWHKKGKIEYNEKIQKTEKNASKAKLKRRKLYRRTGRRFFERYELAIRHYQAVHGKQPVFERFWHFWGNHFAIIDKVKLPVFNTGPMQRDQLRPMMTEIGRAHV